MSKNNNFISVNAPEIPPAPEAVGALTYQRRRHPNDFLNGRQKYAHARLHLYLVISVQEIS